MYKVKLHRDKVITSSDKHGDIVGVYIKYPHFYRDTDGTVGEYSKEVLLAEMKPDKADKFIKLWNK